MSSINGIGTTYIGCSDVRKDGSFVTTKWVSFIIPIVPVGSFRVLPTSHINLLFLSSSKFQAQSVPLHWPHVVQLYATYLAAFLFFYVSNRLLDPKFSHRVSSPLLSSLLAFAFAFLAMGISSFIRKRSMFANLIAIAFILMSSFLVVGNISGDPEMSLKYMYFFWGTYTIFAISKFLKDEGSADKNKKVRG